MIYCRVCFLGCLGFLLSGCAISPEPFGRVEPAPELRKYEYQKDEWRAYDSGSLLPGYPETREVTLKQDPSRGIGLKQSQTMGAGPATVPSGSSFRVFLLMGQSNMVGYGKAGKLTPPLNQPHPRVRIWSNRQWQFLVPRKSFGPEVTFAQRMAEFFPGDTIGIIKVAVSGTGMNAWKPDWEWAEATKTGDALKGSLYRDMINAVSGAHEVSEFQLSGFVWKQGGRDGRKMDLAETYQERFVELVNHMRADLGTPDLPVFVLTYFDEQGIEEHRELLEKVRPKAMPLYLSKARVSQYLHNAFPVFHGRLSTRMDQVHFDTEGQLQLGLMTADAVCRYYADIEKYRPGEQIAHGDTEPVQPD